MARFLVLLAVALCLSAEVCFAQQTEGGTDAQKRQQLSLDRLVNKLPQFSMAGPLKQRGGDRWQINGEDFYTDDKTIVEGDMKNGSVAEVRGFIAPRKPKVAREVRVIEQPSARTGRSTVSAAPPSGKPIGE